MTFAEAYWEIQKTFSADAPELVDTSLGDFLMPFEMMPDQPIGGTAYNSTAPVSQPAFGTAETEAPNMVLGGFTVTPLPPMLGRDWDDKVAGGFPLIPETPADGAYSGASPSSGPYPGSSPGAGRTTPMPMGASPMGASPRTTGGYPGGRSSAYPGSSYPSSPRTSGSAYPGGVRSPGMPTSSPRSTPYPGASPYPGTRSSGGYPMSGASPRTRVDGGGMQRGYSGEYGAGGQMMDPASDILFRFFDFTAEEGKTYQYRVALELENPNYELSEALLKDPRLREGKVRYSPFSESTASVKMALPAAEVVAGPVRPARLESGAGESGTLILLQRERASGAFVTHTFNRVEAGQVLNFRADKIKYEKPSGMIAEDPLSSLDFRSDAMLVDLKGGGDRGWPGEMLVLDAEGRLTLRSELAPLKMPVWYDETDPEAVPPPMPKPVFDFAFESKKLEYIYNYEHPSTTPEGTTGFDLLSPPMSVPRRGP
jgi:hypothetical protein